MKTQESKLLKLNLGCGDRAIPGFVNIDARDAENTDVILDLFEVGQIYENQCSLLYSCHVLEHFKKKDIKELLTSWAKSLVSGGTIRLSVPNFDNVVDYYRLTKDIVSLQSFLHGGQKYPLDYHYISFNFEFLESILEEVGFCNVRLYDYKDTEHFYIDDYSQSYLPHMDKTHGMLMSLNVEATKL
jgi:predicted SAM-dependent methyltransferase